MANIEESADTPDELTIFNGLEKETLKLDRLILQQSETMSRLKKIKEKLQMKKEKENLKSAHYDNQLKSLLTANRMSKENLKSKRQSRCMSEEMVTNLERQLQLENIDAENKVKGFKLTQKKYDDLWKNYEAVYYKMPHNVNKANAEKDFKKASELISSMRADADKIKVQIAEAHKRKHLEMIKCVLLIAKHERVHKLEEDVKTLREKKEELAAEVSRLEIDVKNSNSEKAIEQMQQNQRKSRIRNLMNSLSESTSSMQLVEYRPMAIEITNPQDARMDPMTLFEIDENFFTEISENMPDEEPRMDLNTMVSHQQDPEVPRELEQPTSAAAQIAAPQQESATMDGNVAMDTTPPLEAASTPKTPSSNMILEKVVASEAIQPVAKVSEQLPIGLEEPMSEDEAADLSQTTMVPADLQAEQQQILNSCSQLEPSETPGRAQLQPVAPIPTPAWDGTGSDVGGETLSQGTDSTTGSVSNLLDDEKRHEYMRRLMATPTFSMTMDDLPNEEEIEMSSTNSTADQACMQNFYSLLADDNVNANLAAPPTMSVPQQQQQAPPTPLQPVAVNPATSATSGNSSNAFMFPATTTPAPHDGFGGFGNFFGGAPVQNTSSFFGTGFGDAPAQNASQPANSEFAFNFGGPSNNTQSFMNLF